MLLFSCLEESDQLQDNTARRNDQLVHIRNWFEANKQDLRIKDSGLNQRQDSKELILPFFEKEPDWSKFHIYQWPDGRQVFEVNLSNKEIVLNSQFTDNLPDADPSKTVIQNILFVENKQNGRFDPVIARYYPADEYSVSRFEEISYNNIGAGWSGTVDIWTYDERYFVGFIIEDGQLIATKHPEGYQPDSRKRKSTLQGENLDTTCRHVVSIYTVVTIVTAGNGSEISYHDETEVHMVCSGGTLYNDLDTNGTPIPRYDYDPYGGGWGGVSGEINYTPPSISEPLILKKMKCSDLMNTHGEEFHDIHSFKLQNIGKTYENIINQREDKSWSFLGSQKGGPNIRYIRDPLNPNIIIDLRHLLIIGRLGPIIGNSVEVIQWVSGSQSAYDDQDYYSNELGYSFWANYSNLVQRNPTNFVELLENFLYHEKYRNSISSPNRCNLTNNG
ncbi:hypothetical protein [Cecembia rubra]|uniref:Uncharacterized protein n=1 Tax=Cecembia rubra TaxID=1485585 RepID=A0A2P8E0M6_9BACT|nr:hypothetical protein [Cecembia rubra]PSL03009.1 hypothetical protein CLV48_108118 [Cecembia rubra]